MKNKVLLIYPALGFAGSYVINVPIGLVYVAAGVVRISDVNVEILDCRIHKNWEKTLREELAGNDVLLAGVSVMSGMPVAEAYKITKLIKEVSDVPVAWGGAHPTIMPEDSLRGAGTDFCIRGFGSVPFAELVRRLKEGTSDFGSISGICYRNGKGTIISKINDCFENIDFRDLPYDLIESFIEQYFATQTNRVFPIYTAAGCPYQCSFCISPVWYKELRKKWVPFNPSYVVDHIEYLIERFSVDTIYLYDDDTFVKISHFSSIARELYKRKVKVDIGIRGIRVNEILKMKPEDFELLERVGVKFIHVGIESGSQRMLDLMKKGITVEQSLKANRILKKYPGITPMYNILCGIPTETIHDLIQTGQLMLKLSEENPNSIIFDPGKFIPYPGSELCDLATKHGFSPPSEPEEWANLDQESDVYMPWYDKRYNRFIKMLQLASYPLSNWEKYLESYPWWLRVTFKIAKCAYKPGAKLRVRYGFDRFLFEYHLLLGLQELLKKTSRFRMNS